MDDIEILTQARELLAQPGKWTRQAFARDAAGEEMHGHEPSAVQFCAIGAIERVTGQRHRTCAEPPVTALRETIRGMVVGFNDSQSTVEPVLDVFDRTIARLEAAQGAAGA